MAGSLLKETAYANNAFQLLETCKADESRARRASPAHDMGFKENSELAGEKVYLEMQNPKTAKETFIFLSLAHAQKCEMFVHFMLEAQESVCPFFDFKPRGGTDRPQRIVLTGVCGGYRKHEICYMSFSKWPGSKCLKLKITSTKNKADGQRKDDETAEEDTYTINYFQDLGGCDTVDDLGEKIAWDAHAVVFRCFERPGPENAMRLYRLAFKVDQLVKVRPGAEERVGIIGDWGAKYSAYISIVRSCGLLRPYQGVPLPKDDAAFAKVRSHFTANFVLHELLHARQSWTKGGEPGDMKMVCKWLHGILSTGLDKLAEEVACNVEPDDLQTLIPIPGLEDIDMPDA